MVEWLEVLGYSAEGHWFKCPNRPATAKTVNPVSFFESRKDKGRERKVMGSVSLVVYPRYGGPVTASITPGYLNHVLQWYVTLQTVTYLSGCGADIAYVRLVHIMEVLVIFVPLIESQSQQPAIFGIV